VEKKWKIAEGEEENSGCILVAETQRRGRTPMEVMGGW
jgi:hypothetical protein